VTEIFGRGKSLGRCLPHKSFLSADPIAKPSRLPSSANSHIIVGAGFL
jgi:hypothetical protein